MQETFSCKICGEDIQLVSSVPQPEMLTKSAFDGIFTRSVEVFLGESLIKYFSKKQYWWFFNTTSEFSKFWKCFLNFAKYLIFLQKHFLG